MYFAIRRAGTRSKLRIAIAATIGVLALTLAAAHSSYGSDHMSEMAAMCLAVASVAAVAVASAPRLNRLVPTPSRPTRDARVPIGQPPSVPHDGRARGHPALLQVLRR